MTSVIDGLDPADYQRDPLHKLDRDWPETNCYMDLWIEVLSALGKDPRAGLGFTLLQDFEGDQMSFFKIPTGDLERLFGVVIQELAIFDDLADHIAVQIARGRLPLIEVDGFFLPDTKDLSYRLAHTKTTIAINRIDRAAREMDYFHNAGYFRVSGQDFDGLLGQLPEQQSDEDRLFPYAEFAKLDKAANRTPSVADALDILRRHFEDRPSTNPIRAFLDAFPDHLARLADRDPEFFHAYTFNTMRQLGANFELLASHCEWLSEQGRDGGVDATAALTAARDQAAAISASSKVLQFQLARAVAKRKMDRLVDPLERMAANWDNAMRELGRALAGMTAGQATIESATRATG